MDIYKKFFTAFGKIGIFDDLTEPEIKDFLSESRSCVCSYEKNEVLFLQGDAYNVFSIVVEGICVSEMNDFSGRTVSLGSFTAPFPVAPGFLFLEEAVLPVSLRAYTSVTALLIPKDKVFDHLSTNDIFLRNFLRLLSSRVEYLTGRVSFHSFRTIREKLLMYVRSLKRDNSSMVTLPMSVEDLARYFGVARPSLSQVFIDLQKEGLFVKKGRKIFFTPFSR